MKKKPIYFLLIGLALIFNNCSPGDILKVDEQAKRIFEMKKSGDISELPTLFHPRAPEDLNIEFFEKLFANQNNVLGEYVSHKRESFSFQTKNGVKTFQVFYEVKYSKVDAFYEMFNFQSDEDGSFKLIGYQARSNREDME